MSRSYPIPATNSRPVGATGCRYGGFLAASGARPLNPTTTVRAGDTIDVAVTVENAHFFDLESGLAIRG